MPTVHDRIPTVRALDPFSLLLAALFSPMHWVLRTGLRSTRHYQGWDAQILCALLLWYGSGGIFCMQLSSEAGGWRLLQKPEQMEYLVTL